MMCIEILLRRCFSQDDEEEERLKKKRERDEQKLEELKERFPHALRTVCQILQQRLERKDKEQDQGIELVVFHSNASFYQSK